MSSPVLCIIALLFYKVLTPLDLYSYLPTTYVYELILRYNEQDLCKFDCENALRHLNV